MKVMVAHVKYRTSGGEESVVALEAKLLAGQGADVTLLTPASGDFDRLSRRARLGVGATFADHAYGRAVIREAIASNRPDIIHFHNLFPLLGPGAVAEARSAGCGVVQTLHNFRLECVAGTHLLHGEICERCNVGHHAPGVLNACYRGSRAQSLAMARAQRRLWADAVGGRGAHRLLPLTEFAAQRILAAGMPSHLVTVKPNSAEASLLEETQRTGVVYVGRLSPEKGVDELVKNWPVDAPTLTVAGDGDLLMQLRSQARENVSVVGRLAPQDVRRTLRTARVALLPSLWYEGMPAAALEAYAEDTPVVLFGYSAFAGFAAEVDERCVVAGRRIEDFVQRAIELHDASDAFRGRAQSVFDARFTNETNGRMLSSIYSEVLREVNGGSSVV